MPVKAVVYNIYDPRFNQALHNPVLFGIGQKGNAAGLFIVYKKVNSWCPGKAGHPHPDEIW